MKKSYLSCLQKMRQFRKALLTDIEQKRGKLYFNWIKSKTEKIENEKNDDYFYNSLVQYTLKIYKIDAYSFERLNEQLKDIVKNNYAFKDSVYIFNNINISKEDALLLAKKCFLKEEMLYGLILDLILEMNLVECTLLLY